MPSLEGKKWEDETDEANSLSSAQRLIIKRAKIDASIVLMESDEKTKYELFQRLNTGGSPLSAQEGRNSILVMLNRDLYEWLRHLSQDEDFQECVSLSDRAVDRQYDLELALRFVVFSNLKKERLRNLGDIGEFLTDQMVHYAETDSLNREEEEKAFRATFQSLRESLGDDSFRKYDADKKRFVGGFLVSAFESVGIGLGINYKDSTFHDEDIGSKVRGMWKDRDFRNSARSGVPASARVPKTVSYGRELFGK